MTTSINYDGGLTCAMSCSDLEQSIGWYQDVLGMTLLYRMDEMGWCELTSPVARVNVGLSVVEDLAVQGGATLTFGVTDIDEASVSLESQDVRFDGETQTIPEMVRLATFFDPDGNKLMFFQDLSSS